jgi:hypothetical protein
MLRLLQNLAYLVDQGLSREENVMRKLGLFMRKLGLFSGSGVKAPPVVEVVLMAGRGPK